MLQAVSIFVNVEMGEEELRLAWRFLRVKWMSSLASLNKVSRI
jgi:hypothetical protein